MEQKREVERDIEREKEKEKKRKRGEYRTRWRVTEREIHTIRINGSSIWGRVWLTLKMDELL